MLRLYLLGSIDLRDGASRELRSVLAQPKRIALLGYLAAAHPGRMHRRASLLPLFWPELDEAHARAALRKSLHVLRRSLGGDVLLVPRGGEELGVSPEHLWCDVKAFRAAMEAGDHETALDLYARGRLMDGLAVTGAAAFDTWLDRERLLLRRQAVEAASALATEAEAAGDLHAAVQWARRAADLSPYDEPAHRRLLGALDALGDRAGAMATYERFVESLQNEMDLEPSPETKALADAIRSRSELSGVVPYPATEPPSTRPLPAGASIPPAGGDAATTALRLASGAPEASTRALVPSPIGPRGTRRRFARRRAVRGALGVGGVSAMLGLGWSYLGSNRVDFDPEIIAVMPFEDRTGDPERRHDGVIVAERLVRDLVRLEEVRPVSLGETMMLLRDPSQDRPSLSAEQFVAEATKAALVISGSYYLAGDDVVFEATVYDAEEKEVVFGTDPIRAQRDDPTTSFEPLEESLFGSIGMLGRRQVSGKLLTRPPSYAAYREFALSREAFLAFDWRGVAEHAEAAARIDSTFFWALYQAGVGYVNAGNRAGAAALLPRMKAMQSELLPVERGGLDWLRGMVEGDLRLAHAGAVRMAEVVPTSPPVYLAGMMALWINRPAEAIDYFELFDLERVGPTWPAIWVQFAAAHHQLGHHRTELRLIRRGRRQHPERLDIMVAELKALAARHRGAEVEERIAELELQSPGVWPSILEVAEELEVHGDPAAAGRVAKHLHELLVATSEGGQETPGMRFLLGRTLAALGRHEEAVQVFGRLREGDPDNGAYATWLGIESARLGDSATAEEMVTWLGAVHQSNRLGFNVLSQAPIAAALGDVERAVHFLREAEDRGAQVFGTLHARPAFRAVRSDPAFQAYLAPRG